MNKRFLTLILTLTAMLMCIFSLTACGNKEISFKLNFVVDDTVYATIDTSGDEVIALPENPTKEGYTFDGWFWDKDTWQTPFTANSLLDAPLSSDMSVYAKFSLIHNCDFKEKVASDIYKATGATCDNKATYYFSCYCGEMGTETFESGVAQGHSFTNYISDNNATCEVDGTKTAVCNRNGCNETDTITDVNSKLGHSFTNYISDNNATYDADGTKTALCNRNGCNETDTITDNGSKLQSYFGFNLGYTINNRKAYIKVCSTTKTIYFPDEIVLKGNATYKVYKDIGCENELKGKELVLENVGENKCYILATVNGEDTLYHVTIYLRTKYTVNFITNNNTTIESQVIEEDSLAQKPNDLVKAGYTFNGWSYNFANPIIKNETITAIWSANKNTPYKVEYYLENLNDDNYTLTKTENLTGTTDTTAYANIKSFTGFTAEVSEVKGNINANASLVLKVYYQRNEYTVSNADTSLGSITGAGKYKYGKQVTLTATIPNLGYDFCWYNGEALLSDSLNYTVTIDKDITAKYTVKAEMSNFNFTSTATTCSISGVKDKTITEIIVPNYVTSINEGAFSGCNKLESITIPFVGAKAGVTSNNTYQYPFGYIFGTSSYTGSYSATQYYYGDNTSSTTSTEYYIPTSLKEVTVTGGNILRGAFYSCKNLTSIEIPNSVTSIGEDAFRYCKNLTSITIGNSVTSIGTYAFYSCDNLEKVYYLGDINSWVKIQFDRDYANPLHYAKELYINNELVTTVNITTATKINDYAFYGYNNLTSLTILDSVTSIGEEAFYDCSSLTSVTIGNSVTSIGSYAFSSCDTLTSVTIGNGVTSIGEEAFSSCDSLTSVTIGNSVTSIGDRAFYSCDSLTSIVIPNSVTSIGVFAFYNCSKLTSLMFSDTSTWYRTTSISNWNNKTNGTSTSVTSSSSNANYFKSTNYGYYWYKL